MSFLGSRDKRGPTVVFRIHLRTRSNQNLDDSLRPKDSVDWVHFKVLSTQSPYFPFNVGKFGIEGTALFADLPTLSILLCQNSSQRWLYFRMLKREARLEQSTRLDTRT